MFSPPRTWSLELTMHLPQVVGIKPTAPCPVEFNSIQFQNHLSYRKNTNLNIVTANITV